MTALFRPPVPPPPAAPLGLWKLLHAMRTNALGMWPEEYYERDLVVAPLLGRATILLNRAEDIHHVLVECPEKYQRTAATVRILRPITGHGLLLSDGENWRWQRRTVAPALAPRSLPVLMRHVVTATEDAVGTLGAAAGPRAGAVDMLAAMQALALEIAGRSMFSLETKRFGARMRAMLMQYAERLARPYLLDMLLPPAIPAPRDLPRYLFQRRWMRLMDGIIAERLAAPEADAPRDLFDMLRAARDPETGRAFTARELRDQIATLILAGHETTGVALFWSLYLLANAPDVQDRVATEAAAVTITPQTATAALEHLPYTRAVLNEALRLFPPAFTLVRQARVADRIGDMDVPPGSVIIISPWVLHRHRGLWQEPDLFDPSRFLPGAPAIPRFAYLPFGAGPRICVGAQFALAEATLVLARLMRAFRVALAPGETALPVAVITTQPDHPAGFILTNRTQ